MMMPIIVAQVAKTNGSIVHQWAVLGPMATDCMIWQETSGNGVPTGIVKITIKVLYYRIYLLRTHQG